MKEAGPFTRYNSQQAAEETLAAMMVWKDQNDPSSSCKVEPLGRHFVIVYHDEDGVRIGTL